MRDISNFMSWFITQFINIGTTIIGHLDNIKIWANVTLLDFIICITIIGIFIPIILTLPQNMNKFESRAERKKAQEERSKKK